ncbi:alpha/beta fold hydrolase [Mycolicibacterium sp.]|uniref:alpha/beta fold hydrolase n=1 Tax=Mycolicibacterium sp. TaxID=2320850 RepID=UPI003D0DF51F
MDFHSPTFVTTNGIRMEYFEQGKGPVVLLLHGFPELPFSWRHVVDPLADAGFRVVVPTLRGYGGTDAPEGPQGYNIKNIVADLTGLLDALGVEQAVWFGHDAGALPAWFAGIYAPERVLALGAIGVPYAPLQGELDMVELYDLVKGPNNYVRAFQEPGLAESLLERDVEHTFRSLMRGRGYTMAEFLAAPPEIQELPIGFLVGDPQLFGEPILSDDEIRYYVQAFEHTGFTGGLNWYRALHQDYEEALGLDYVIDKPALFISAADDWLAPGSGDGMDALLPQLEQHTIADVAHWVQQEKPAEVTAILLGWLQRTFMTFQLAQRV